MSNLKIHVSQIEGEVPVSVLNVAGNIDAKNHWELDGEAEKLINNGATNILINLTDSDDMCCAGFRSIYRTFVGLRRGEEGKARLKLLKPTDRVKRMMKTMGFDVLIPTYNNMDEAVKSFA
jgi:anti-anti-sigma factor